MAVVTNRRHESRSLLIPVIGLIGLVFGMYYLTMWEQGRIQWGWEKKAEKNSVLKVVNSSEERRSLDLSLMIDGKMVIRDSLLRTGNPISTAIQLGVGSHKIVVSSIEAELRHQEVVLVEDSTQTRELTFFFRETSAEFAEKENAIHLENLIKRRKHSRSKSELSAEEIQTISIKDSIEFTESVKVNPKYSFEEKGFYFKLKESTRTEPH